MRVGDAGDEPTVKQQFTFKRTPDTAGSFNLFVQHELPESLPRFELHLEGHGTATNLRTAWGYTFEDGRKLVWDGSTTSPRAHLELSLTANAERWYVDTGDWTLAKYPLYSVFPREVASVVDLEERYRVVGEGVVTEAARLLYLGEHSEWSARVDDTTLRLVVPAPAELSAEPREVIDTLARAVVAFDVDCRNDSVVAIAAPTREVDELDVAGVSDGTSGFWVRDDHRVDTVSQGIGGCAWIHEYLHTRLDGFEGVTRHLSWLTEAIPSYYAGLLPLRQGRVPYDEFLSFVRTDRDSDAVLTDSYTLGGSTAPYTKGRRVLAALDCKLQRESDGAACLMDMIRELNDYEDVEITYSMVEAVLESLSDWPVSRWLDRYARTTAVPEVPDSRNCFGRTWVSPPKRSRN